MGGEYEQYVVEVERHVRPREVAALVLGFCGSRLRDLRCDRCDAPVWPRKVLRKTRNGWLHESVTCHERAEFMCSNPRCLCYYVACEECSLKPLEKMWRDNPAWDLHKYMEASNSLKYYSIDRMQHLYDLYPIDELLIIPDAFPINLRKFAGVNLKISRNHDSCCKAGKICSFAAWRPLAKSTRDKLGCLADEPPQGIEGSDGNGTNHWACQWCQNLVYFTSK